MNYKWRKRLYYKWKEEMRQLQALPPKIAVAQESTQMPQQQQQPIYQHQLPQHPQQPYVQLPQQQQSCTQPSPSQQQQSTPPLLTAQVDQQLQQQPQQQRQQLQQLQPLAAVTTVGKSFHNFVEDPVNLQKLFLSRRTIQLLAHRSDFQRIAKGCFVRVKYGNGYRVAQVQGFGKVRPGSEPTLILRLDNNPRVFPLDQLTNSYFEPGEVLDWKYVWKAYNFELPTKRMVDLKYKMISDAKLQSQAQLRCNDQCHVHKMRKNCLVHNYHDMHPMFGPRHAANARATAQQQNTVAAAATSGTSRTFVSPGSVANPMARKYLVEPMDCYKPYLPKLLPATAQAAPFKVPLEPPLHGIAHKKKISLDEYRERCIKKQNCN